jgi:hypothetical protein
MVPYRGTGFLPLLTELPSANVVGNLYLASRVLSVGSGTGSSSDRGNRLVREGVAITSTTGCIFIHYALGLVARRCEQVRVIPR